MRKPDARFIDPTGKRFGSLTVVREATRAEISAQPQGSRKGRWYFLACACGKDKVLPYRRYEKYIGCGANCPFTRKPNLKSKLLPGEAGKREAYRTMQGLQAWGKNHRKQSMSRKEFTLSFAEFVAIVVRPCTYCGVSGTLRSGEHKYRGELRTYGLFVHSGIDRIDSAKGYILGNCAPCCTACNRAKSVMSQDEFRLWIDRAYHHFVANKEAVA